MNYSVDGNLREIGITNKSFEHEILLAGLAIIALRGPGYRG